MVRSQNGRLADFKASDSDREKNRDTINKDKTLGFEMCVQNESGLCMQRS